MRKYLLPALGLVLLGVFLLSVPAPAAALPPLQQTPFFTPSPGPDGRILYTVQEGDTLWYISAVTGVSIDQLRILNNLDAEDVIVPGQVLILGVVGAATATGGAVITPLPTGPSPTPGPGTASICVVLYNDVNGDALRQQSEPSIPGGAVSVSETSGLFADSATTADGFDPEDTDLAKSVCFTEMPGGNYNVSVAIPDGYNSTTALNSSLELAPGDETNLNFGAQVSTDGLLENPPPQEGGRSPLLGVAGFAFVIGGILVGVISARMRRSGQAKTFGRG